MGESKRNCVFENRIPEWVDLVVWGHEHECIENVQTNEETGVFFLYPGSTTPTSLVEAESKQKHCFMITVEDSHFKCDALPLRSARPFIHRNIELGSSGVDPSD